VVAVSSAGVYLPMQDEVFPDEDDFGRIFRNNAVLSAMGVPQYAAIMGNCVAGGAYLPVLCDKVLMVKGSQLALAGAALVKAALGQSVDPEELGGAQMHAQVSGTVDFVEEDDQSCLDRLRELVALHPPLTPSPGTPGEGGGEGNFRSAKNGPSPLALSRRTGRGSVRDSIQPRHPPSNIYSLFPTAQCAYDARDLLAFIVDRDTLLEYKADYGKTLLCAYARLGGRAVGVVANQHQAARTRREGVQIGGVIYHDSADKAARFVMDCSQGGLPLLFFQDVQGFMVGRDSEQSGVIRSGAKLVNAVSNAAVPKITVIVGGSFGAGNYALCGKAFDPHFIFAWPGARYAVMGAEQASKTLLSLAQRQAERGGNPLSPQALQRLRETIKSDYEKQTDIRYGAARGWVDAIIAPHTTRDVLIEALTLSTRPPPAGGFRGGVLQV
jgi:acetyl-CoA carboxylase carboxyltransferase component